MDSSNPVLIEVTRGGAVESRHRGACVVMAADGRLVHGLGDVQRRVFPRSAIKPVQALPLIETGAAARFDVTDAEIALACASHNGEVEHVAAVRAWLARLGLDEADLACGAHPSINAQVALEMAQNGVTLGRAHNNCSGKHTGFLCTALHMNEPLAAYERADHPVQRRVARAMEEMTGVRLDMHACGIDGCGIPACAMPLDALALAMARMTDTVRRPAAARIIGAMMAYPGVVAGTDRADTHIMTVCAGRVASKAGAEGMHIAMVPERGWGIALKIDDGAARASDVAMVNVLNALGLLDDDARVALAELLVKPLANTLGAIVGDIRSGPGLVF
ncbi:MAG: asparaginase [Rhodospirillales bacterium]|nr:asparaginase [Rhodospirillales bacterium]